VHNEVRQFVAAHAPDRPVTVLDIGGRDINGTNRDSFPQVVEWVSVDLRDGPRVDVVADAADMDLGRTFDVVVCTEVFEHTESWPFIVESAARHLETGGMFIVTCAGPGRGPHSGIDGGGLHDGEFYENVPAESLRVVMLAAGFSPVECVESGTDTQCIAWKA
jgi:SAM-dependent methyltransferase